LLNGPENLSVGRELDSVFSALADPTRRGILERLGDGEATVSELAEPFSISLPAISRHLKVLESAGLIARGRRAQWRTNRLRTAPLDDAGEWMEHLRLLWDGRLNRLEAHLRELNHLSGRTTDTST
jgi:DNA-binding transcriptional ArsR family regulator